MDVKGELAVPIGSKGCARLAVATLAVASSAVMGVAVASAQIAGAPTVVNVTNCNDSGAGSLRQVVADAISGDTIEFALSPVCSLITLTSGEIDVAADLTIRGPGRRALAVSGDNHSRVFVVGSSVTDPAVISGLTIEKGTTASSLGGGCIINEGALSLRDSTVSGCSAVKGGGGGIFNNDTLTLTHTTVSGNTASGNLRRKGYGGGIDNEGSLTLTRSIVSDNHSRVGGGGIYNSYIGPLTVTDSTLSGNRVTDGEGGGIWNNEGTLSITDSTLSRNHANNGEVGWGGGIYYLGNGNGSVTIDHATMSGNSAALGGGIYDDDATSSLEATIVANNGTGLDCQGGGVTDDGYNLDDDGSCGFSGTSLSDTPAGLDPAGLARHGGPNKTIALQATSAAIGAVSVTSLCGGRDQRGIRRPAANCDIGAYQRALGIGPATLAKATVGKAYRTSLTVFGGTSPYRWKLSGGSLPAGLSLSRSGRISGTPTTAGTYRFVVKVSDASTPTITSTKAYSLTLS